MAHLTVTVLPASQALVCGVHGYTCAYHVGAQHRIWGPLALRTAIVINEEAITCGWE